MFIIGINPYKVKVGVFCFYTPAFCDIIQGMRKRNLYILSVLSCLMTVPAHADWQYPGTYVGDGWYDDDGTRFVISARGGASFGMGKIENGLGAVSIGYYMLPDSDQIIPWGQCAITNSCDDLTFAGYGEIAKLPATKDYESFSFAAGASIGWTIPNRPQWRIEAGWDHIAESEYNSSPMFKGDLPLVGGAVDSAPIESASVNSEISTDVISVMAFYDFFDGIQKPSRSVIPYIGIGVGYADTTAILNLYDPYGDISAQQEFSQYGEPDDYNLTQFYRSEYTTPNVAGLLSLGLSYGITETLFLDFGVRGIYLPRVKWELVNTEQDRHREVFSAENMIYINAMLGIRFEF